MTKDKAYRLIATVFGISKIPFLPATLACLAASFIWFVILFLLEKVGISNNAINIILTILLITLLAAGIVATHFYYSRRGEENVDEIVIDKFLGQLLSFYLMTAYNIINNNYIPPYSTIILLFVIFRLVEIIKLKLFATFNHNFGNGITLIISALLSGIVTTVILYYSTFVYFMNDWSKIL